MTVRWDRRTQDKADSKQMDVAKKATGMMTGGLGLMVKCRAFKCTVRVRGWRRFEE